jgi:hypothetical protein
VRAIGLQRFPAGIPETDDFVLLDLPSPPLNAGGVRIALKFLSLDPYLRGVISGRHLGHAIALGDVIPGGGVGVVVESDHADWRVGDWVQAETGWRDEAVLPADRLRRLPASVPPSTALGVLGMPGLTAFVGVQDILRPAPAQTIVVSAALGPVGGTVAQLCKRAGARVVGIAGGATKCRLAVERLGYDACIDYRDDHFVAELQRACPERIDGYFDNVGGRVLDVVLGHLNLHARVALCGLIDQYNRAERPPGPNLGPVIAARATLTGLVVYDHFDRLPHMLDALLPLVAERQIDYLEDISHGLTSTPQAFVRLMRGDNIGKALVAL